MEYQILAWEKSATPQEAEGLVQKLADICQEEGGISRKKTINIRKVGNDLSWVREEYQVGTVFVINRYNSSLEQGQLRTEVSYPVNSIESKAIMIAGLKNKFNETYGLVPDSEIVDSNKIN